MHLPNLTATSRASTTIHVMESADLNTKAYHQIDQQSPRGLRILASPAYAAVQFRESQIELRRTVLMCLLTFAEAIPRREEGGQLRTLKRGTRSFVAESANQTKEAAGTVSRL